MSRGWLPTAPWNHCNCEHGQSQCCLYFCRNKEYNVFMDFYLLVTFNTLFNFPQSSCLKGRTLDLLSTHSVTFDFHNFIYRGLLCNDQIRVKSKYFAHWYKINTTLSLVEIRFTHYILFGKKYF